MTSRLAVALLAAGSLIAGAVTAGAAPASAGPDASAAKKKKKKCPTGFTTVRVKGKPKCLPAAGTRATLTWTNGTAAPVDLDLIVWDPSGNRDGGLPFGAIPSAGISPDSQGAGPEIFSDFLNPSVRDFTFGACMSADNGTDDTIATLAYRAADGSPRTVTSLAGQLADDHQFALLHLGTFNPGPAPFCV